MLCFYLGSILLVDSYFIFFFFVHSGSGFVIKFMKRKQNQNYNKIRLQPLNVWERWSVRIFA